MADENNDKKAAGLTIKRVKKHGGHGAHGGAWKVAYADFVTAMMAFFIVMWILGMSEETKIQIEYYFNNAGVFDFLKSDSPVDMKLAPATGKTGKGGEKSSTASRGGFAFFEEAAEAADNKAKGLNEDEKGAKADTVDHEKALMENVKLEQEVKKTLINMAKKDEKIKEILSSIKIEITREGLVIELIETSESVFFEVGSAQLKPQVVVVLQQLAGEIGKISNNVEIEGHTDSRNYGSPTGYSNWELSADRANSARKVMQANGLRPGQLQKVSGYADSRLRKPEDPYDMTNRRITILIRN